MSDKLLIELPNSKVKELLGSKIIAVTDREMCIYNVSDVTEALEMIENLTDTLIKNLAKDGESYDLLATLTYFEWGVRSLRLVRKRDLDKMRKEDPKLVDMLVDVVEDLHKGLHDLID